jgi:3-methyl-2-oxobutanoate hydroxymethyltransferase
MKITAEKIKSMKGKEKISMLTAYDYPFAKILDEVGIDVLLIGDSLGMVVLGYDDTKSVIMEDMIRHTEAVARASKNALVVSDMPFRSFENKENAVKNAKLFIKAGADAVKLEGGLEVIEVTKAIVDKGINVMGHIGLTPQTAKEFKVQGKDKESAKKLIEDAKALDKAGCFSIVLECVPLNLAKKITQAVPIPIIGIGAGPYCDGQVLVIHDILGLFERFKPKFVKRYANLSDEIRKAVSEYKKEVKEGKFPSDEFCFH